MKTAQTHLTCGVRDIAESILIACWEGAEWSHQRFYVTIVVEQQLPHQAIIDAACGSVRIPLCAAWGL